MAALKAKGGMGGRRKAKAKVRISVNGNTIRLYCLFGCEHSVRTMRRRTLKSLIIACNQLHQLYQKLELWPIDCMLLQTFFSSCSSKLNRFVSAQKRLETELLHYSLFSFIIKSNASLYRNKATTKAILRVFFVCRTFTSFRESRMPP